MIPITDPRIESYLEQLSPEDDPQLLAMERRAEETAFPIVERLVGRLLYLLARLKQPALVVELGSGFGYSAYWLARAISVKSKVVLIDHSDANISYARQVFVAAGFDQRAEFRVGDALKIGQEYDDIDLLFIDLDKFQYRDAIVSMMPKLSKNALVIADNALWHGQVAEEGNTEADTRSIRSFNDFMFGRSEFFSTILPVRDGVLVAYRLG